MPFRIRSKFIGILLIAAVFPLSVALVAIEVLGYRYYRGERGRLLEATANFVATSISHNLTREIEKFADWINLAHLNAAIAQRLADASPSLANDASVSTNPLADALREFQSVSPLFIEIVVFDEQGRLLAATENAAGGRPTDELWWSSASQLRPGRLYLKGPALNANGRTHELIVCARLASRAAQGGVVIKAVLDTNPLFTAVPLTIGADEPSREVIDATGRVLFELYSRYERRLGERLAPTVVPAVTSPTSGWTMTMLGGHEEELVGFAPIRVTSPLVENQVPSGLLPLYVIAHDDVQTVLAPVRRQLWLLAVSGLILIILFTGVGYYIATRKIIGPLEQLREAARALARLAQRRATGTETQMPSNPSARQVLDNLQTIQTGDEISDLATDFREMARRVLTYHERLEDAIAEQTAAIQQDLQFAREFQETLMPRDYPRVVSRVPGRAIHLEFHHIYQPASSVGGDFFDVLKLADNRAGVFIADVMGHGARSALVTAILRTLLQDFHGEGHDPARFLRLLNQHFARVAAPSDPLIFVSALYLILDADAQTITLASAGHPAPFWGRRRLGAVQPVYERLQNNPVLGLFPDSCYTNLTHPFEAGDIFVLFTDGVYEAGNLAGEQFGRERLQQAIAQNLDRGVQEICRGVVERVRRFAGNGALPDDICIVGVEVCADEVAAPRSQVVGHW
ncbi:MAG: SpoIIE family protein phosphatase [Verrucomicrobiae bacterium]|nr:SpoIIE family protein phosphatase [Verrucomicrobiae bacterium]